MASNDMNSWDEDPDGRLRQRWQQTFADFEVPARPSLSRRILNTLAAGHYYNRHARMVTLLLLLGTGLLHPVPLGAPPQLAGRYASWHSQASSVQPNSQRHDALAIRSIRQTDPLGLPVIHPPVSASVTARQSPAHRSPLARIQTSGVQVLVKRYTPIRPVSGYSPGSDQKSVVVSGTNPLPPRRPRARLARSPRDKAPAGLAERVARNEYERVSAPGRPLIGLNTLNSLPDSAWVVSPALSPVFPTDIARLEPKQITPLSSPLSALPGQVPAIGSEPQASTVSVVARYWPWFVEAVPLSCFQWMSTSPVSTAHVSQVNTPAAFSPVTWGYQINGGVYFQRWQAHLSLGQLRRWAYYTVNQNRYRVEPSPTNPHQLVRETQGVAENASLPILGAGLSRVTLLARGRYTVELGGQVSFLPTSGERMASIRGEVARRLAVNRHLELQAGLTAEYGLNRLVSEPPQLFIHPFMVGIGLRIQPRSLK